MDEHADVRAILAKALPPSSTTEITRDSAIRAGRHARTRRTWVTTVAASLAVLVLAGGIAWSQQNLAGRSLQPATTGSPAPPTATSAPQVTPSVDPSPGNRSDEPGVQPSRNVKPAITALLLAGLGQVAPGATAKGVDGAWAGLNLGPFEVVKSQGGYKAWAEISDSKGKGTFFMYMGPDGYLAEPWAEGPCQALSASFTCTQRLGPNGERIHIETGKGSGQAYTTYSISIVKADGTQLDVIEDNYSHNDQGVRNPQPQRATPPLTTDQLVSLLTDPRITAV